MKIRGCAFGAVVLMLFPGSAASGSDAVVRLNELNANIANQCDLVELRVLSNGTMDGFQLWQRTTPMLTFSGLDVHTNDIILVHVASTNAVCKPSAACANETSASNQVPASLCSTNVDTAFDWYSNDSGLANSTNVLTLYDGSGHVVDAVLLADDLSGVVATISETQAAAVAAAGQWQQVGGGVPPGGFVGADFRANAALDLNATSVTSGGTTIQRSGDSDTDTKVDWVMAAASWGSLNAGQNPFAIPGVPTLDGAGRVALALALLAAVGTAAARLEGCARR